jgi:hypothetical protein
VHIHPRTTLAQKLPRTINPQYLSYSKAAAAVKACAFSLRDTPLTDAELVRRIPWVGARWGGGWGQWGGSAAAAAASDAV